MKEDKESHIVPFKFPETAEELEPDVYGTMGYLFAIISLVLKMKLVSLFGFFFSIISILNQKESERQGLGSGISLTTVALLISYVAPYLIPLPQSST